MAAKELKLPKLLAAIRANKAHVEKEAKRPRSVPDINPGTANIVATVVTPETPQAPNNYIAVSLEECTSVAHCQELLDHALQHGFSEEGQTVKLIRARMADLNAPKSTSKRGGQR